MAQRDDKAPEKVQRYRFRVVAPDGRELVSSVAQVRFPGKGAEIADFRVSRIFVAAKGKKQGQLKGESARQETKDRFPALSLDCEISSPRDSVTGQARGKRRQSALSIVKEWGAASPQLFQALVTNEVLETVDVDCYGLLESGKEGVVYKLKLSNAAVTSIRQSGGPEAGARELETIAFTFEGIEHLSPAGAVLASDGGHAEG